MELALDSKGSVGADMVVTMDEAPDQTYILNHRDLTGNRDAQHFVWAMLPLTDAQREVVFKEAESISTTTLAPQALQRYITSPDTPVTSHDPERRTKRRREQKK
jgi:hypothetical protein